MHSAKPTSHASEVLVIGAGPAGSTCARHLAERGVDVCLIDRQQFPRYKTCGGGLVGKAMLGLRDVAGVEDTISATCCTAHLSFGRSNTSYRTRRPQPIVCMTMRSQLDASLVVAAQQAGAMFAAPEHVEGVEPTGHGSSAGWSVQTSAGPRQARWIVAADGALGATARLAGMTDDRRLIPAVEYELDVDTTTFERFADTARFDFGFDPSGYAWVFPKRDRLSVGILSHERKPDLHTKLASYLAAMHIRAHAEERHGFVIPVRERRVVAHRNLMMVGDVAGFADPLTAEGISAALLSGKLAAEAIATSARESRVDATATYIQLVRRHLSGELRAARLVARLLYGPTRVRDLVFRRHGQRLCEAVTDVMMGDVSYQTLLRNPRNYLRLLRPRRFASR